MTPQPPPRVRRELQERKGNVPLVMTAAYEMFEHYRLRHPRGEGPHNHGCGWIMHHYTWTALCGVLGPGDGVQAYPEHRLFNMPVATTYDVEEWTVHLFIPRGHTLVAPR